MAQRYFSLDSPEYEEITVVKPLKVYQIGLVTVMVSMFGFFEAVKRQEMKDYQKRVDMKKESI